MLVSKAVLCQLTQTACRGHVGGDLFLSVVPQRIYETLELTEFVNIFKIYEDAALAGVVDLSDSVDPTDRYFFLFLDRDNLPGLGIFDQRLNHGVELSLQTQGWLFLER